MEAKNEISARGEACHAFKLRDSSSWVCRELRKGFSSSVRMGRNVGGDGEIRERVLELDNGWAKRDSLPESVIMRREGEKNLYKVYP